jgi:hypothetical protein
MTNHKYFKGDSFWYWKNGEIGGKPTKNIAHAMGAWSRSLFNEVSGYPHIQSGQDIALENLFEGHGREVTRLDREDVYYVYRFPGTGSYHLSAYGYGKGLKATEKYVRKSGISGVHHIQPRWEQDYLSLIEEILATPSLG